MGMVDKLCQGLNQSKKMWVDYSSANENLLIKKKRMKYKRMPDYIYDTKLDK